MIAIPIQSKTYGEKIFFIDGEDLEKIKGYKWIPRRYKNKSIFYINTYTKENNSLLLHRLIMDFPEGMVVDHIDGNPLNNQKSNLRVCSKAQNTRNRKKPSTGLTSKYKGVHLFKRDNKYIAKIGINDLRKYLGIYDNESDAAIAYNEAAIKYHGEFARLNIIEE